MAANHESASGLTYDGAVQLLDWLENHGFSDRELQIQIDGFFSVSWSCQQ